MKETFDNCSTALSFFCQMLQQRGMPLEKIEKHAANAGHGRILNQDVVYTKTGEVFYIICRPKGRWIPKDSSQVSDMAKPLDSRLKHMIKLFGNEDKSISGLNEDSLIWLLELVEIGRQGYLVTIFPKTGEFLWCSAEEAYAMVMRYGSLPQLSLKGLAGQTMCSIPTGWMKPFSRLRIGPPEFIS